VVEIYSGLLKLHRCFAALGDVSKARYLHETNRLAGEAAQTMVN